MAVYAEHGDFKLVVGALAIAEYLAFAGVGGPLRLDEHQQTFVVVARPPAVAEHGRCPLAVTKHRRRALSVAKDARRAPVAEDFSRPFVVVDEVTV